MPYPLRLIGTFDHFPSFEDLTPPNLPSGSPVVQIAVGDCFFYEGLAPSLSLGAHYLRDWAATRLPLMIFTPAGWWSPDQRALNEQGWHGEGWKVTGTVPQITATPSINFPGRYHGFVQNGVLTDDCEGRKF